MPEEVCYRGAPVSLMQVKELGLKPEKFADELSIRWVFRMTAALKGGGVLCDRLCTRLSAGNYSCSANSATYRRDGLCAHRNADHPRGEFDRGPVVRQ